MLDKMEPPSMPEGYGISVAYICLLDTVKSINFIITEHAPSSTGGDINNYYRRFHAFLLAPIAAFTDSGDANLLWWILLGYAR